MDMDFDYKRTFQNALANKPLQYVLIGGGLLLLVFLLGKKFGKTATVVVDYPKSNGVDDLSAEFTNKSVPNINNALFEAFDGWSLDVDKKVLAITPLLTLTDNQFVYVFNAYNNRYLRGKNQSLYTVIDDDYMGPIGPAATNKLAVLKRMRELGMDKVLV